MNFKAFLNTIGSSARTLPIVILYVTESCNLKCITCSYREALPGELSLNEIKELASQLNKLGLRHIVFSGGEPLLRKDFAEICKSFSEFNVKQSLLTNGLLLEKRVKEIYKYFSEIIVSVDGAYAETHNPIRGVNSFDLIMKGITTALSLPGIKDISIRTVIQKSNFRQIGDMVRLAKSLGVKRISFLSADVLPGAFGRIPGNRIIDKYHGENFAKDNGIDGATSPNSAQFIPHFGAGHAMTNQQDILLNEDEIKEFRQIIQKLSIENKADFDSGFISESSAKLFHMADYFEAHTGKSGFPKTSCNAPMMSAVITSTGEVQPCFFLPAFGNIRKNSVKELINCESVRETRMKVKNYKMERCKTCVCTLTVSSKAALYNRF